MNNNKSVIEQYNAIAENCKIVGTYNDYDTVQITNTRTTTCAIPKKNDIVNVIVGGKTAQFKVTEISISDTTLRMPVAKLEKVNKSEVAVINFDLTNVKLEVSVSSLMKAKTLFVSFFSIKQVIYCYYYMVTE